MLRECPRHTRLWSFQRRPLRGWPDSGWLMSVSLNPLATQCVPKERAARPVQARHPSWAPPSATAGPRSAPVDGGTISPTPVDDDSLGFAARTKASRITGYRSIDASSQSGPLSASLVNSPATSTVSIPGAKSRVTPPQTIMHRVRCGPACGQAQSRARSSREVGNHQGEVVADHTADPLGVGDDVLNTLGVEVGRDPFVPVHLAGSDSGVVVHVAT